MKSVKQIVSSTVINEGINYIEKNPVQNLEKLLNWGEKLVSKENHKEYAQAFHKILTGPDNNWRDLIVKAFSEYDANILKML